MLHSRVFASDGSPVAPNGAAERPAARQTAGSGTGTADARRADDSAAAAVPSGEKPWRWAPRPKPDPLTQEPECGWQAARAIQRKRKAAQTAAKRNPRHIKEAGIAAHLVAKANSEAERELARQACPIEQAVLALRRRGRVVYRLSVHGGPRDIFFCSGKRLTEAELVAEAGRLAR